MKSQDFLESVKVRSSVYIIFGLLLQIIIAPVLTYLTMLLLVLLISASGEDFGSWGLGGLAILFLAAPMGFILSVIAVASSVSKKLDALYAAQGEETPSKPRFFLLLIFYVFFLPLVLAILNYISWVLEPLSY